MMIEENGEVEGLKILGFKCEELCGTKDESSWGVG
jgi:hypothetical protein